MMIIISAYIGHTVRNATTRDVVVVVVVVAVGLHVVSVLLLSTFTAWSLACAIRPGGSTTMSALLHDNGRCVFSISSLGVYRMDHRKTILIGCFLSPLFVDACLITTSQVSLESQGTSVWPVRPVRFLDNCWVKGSSDIDMYHANHHTCPWWTGADRSTA
jgi:hypothetical protein